MLAAHPRIHTESEPWLLLPLIYSRRKSGIYTEYGCDFSTGALEVFLRRINGLKLYDECIRQFAESLYTQASSNTGADHFLDKTPRNYLIIEDIVRIFPTAKLIFLLRHPVAIFSSILDGVDGNWPVLLQDEGIKLDLLEAPTLIANAIRSLENPIVVHYEDLVRTPEATMRCLCKQLGLEFNAATLKYEKPDPDFMGDPKSIRNHTFAVGDYIDLWRNQLQGRSALGLARACITSLDQQVLEIYRIEKSDLLSELSSLGGEKRSKKWSKRLSEWHRMGRTARIFTELEFMIERQGLLAAVQHIVRKVGARTFATS